MRFVVTILCIISAPSVVASGELHLGPVHLLVDNGHHSGCAEPSGLCLASIEGTNLYSHQIDARQNIAFIGVAINDSEAESATGMELLPDRALVLDAGWLVIEHDVFVILVHEVGTTYAPAPLDDFGLLLDNETYGVAFFGPPLQDPAGEMRPRSNAHNFSDEGIGYERLGPFNVQGNTSTDESTQDALTFPCLVLRDEECHSEQKWRAKLLAERTPNVEVGLSFYDIGIATSPDAFANGIGSDRAPVAEGIAPRSSLVAPKELRSSAPGGALPASTAGAPSPARDHVVPRATSDDPHSRALAADVPTAPSRPHLPLAWPISIALVLLTAALFFTRFHRDEALRHERRARILAALETHGPQSFPQLGEMLGVDRTTVEYHTRMLARTGHIKIARGARLVYALLPGQELDPALTRTDTAAAEALVDILRASGGVMPRLALHEAAPAFSQRARNAAIAQLAAAGRIERAIQGNVEVVRLTSLPP